MESNENMKWWARGLVVRPSLPAWPLKAPLQIIPVKVLIQKTGQKIRLLKDLPEIQHYKNKPLKATPNLPDYFDSGQGNYASD